MSEQTRYFPERFKVASQFYTTGRPTYPPLLSRRVVRAAIAKHADDQGLVHEVLEGHALIARRAHDLATN